ncbi:MAG: 3-isopropylmalate dehydratase large subunit [Planctomycetota bacterium]
MTMPHTLLDKIWAAHEVVPESADAPAVLYIDLHLVHEVTSPQAFTELKRRGLTVRRPDRSLATMDHSTPTLPAPGPGLPLPIVNDQAASQIAALADHCREFGIRLADMDSPDRGIVHVMGPEQGATHPGMTIVCGDSHTSTHGAFGALAFGIGTSEVGHVLATQCLLQRKPRSMAIQVDGELPPGVFAKDLILAIIATVGVGGGTGHAFEYRGEAVHRLTMEERMTICNMSIEGGARAGMVAPDETTFAYVEGRALAPTGSDWERALDRWRSLASDEGAAFDKTVHLDAADLRPMVTWGTNPAAATGIDGRTPSDTGDDAEARALEYMGLSAGQPMAGQRIDVAFIGSCTNSRMSDLRRAAEVLRGRRVADHVRMLVVPGSQRVKAQAEAEGLDEVFTLAGAEWRESGCSMCIAMNGDSVDRGEYAVSTSNRNFEGRQGQGARTFLASPATVAASAVAGCLADPRDYLRGDEFTTAPAPEGAAA